MPKIAKGGPFGLFENSICWKISEKLKMGSLGDIEKFSEKVSQSRKIERRDPLVSCGFANAGKSFRLKQGLEPATVGFPLNRLTHVTKKRYIQGELCGLTKKIATFSQKAQTKKRTNDLYKFNFIQSEGLKDIVSKT